MSEQDFYIKLKSARHYSPVFDPQKDIRPFHGEIVYTFDSPIGEIHASFKDTDLKQVGEDKLLEFAFNNAIRILFKDYKIKTEKGPFTTIETQNTSDIGL